MYSTWKKKCDQHAVFIRRKTGEVAHRSSVIRDRCIFQRTKVETVALRIVARYIKGFPGSFDFGSHWSYSYLEFSIYYQSACQNNVRILHSTTCCLSSLPNKVRHTLSQHLNACNIVLKSLNGIKCLVMNKIRSCTSTSLMSMTR